MYYSQFRAFHAVATHGGFSKAADSLGLTQPALSDQVKKLEERFNVLLFHRHKRVVRLTPLGEQLFAITQKSFQLETQAIDLLSAHQTLAKGHLSVAADSPLHVIPLIGKFKKSYEGVAVSMHIGNAEQIISGLLDFSYDLGIVADMEKDSRFTSLTLCEDPLVAFVSRTHPLAQRDSITLKELSKFPLIMREPGSRTRNHTEEEFSNARLPMNIVMEVQGREAVREAVAAEIGVGIVSEPEFGHDSRLKSLRLSDCKATMTESLVCLKEKRHLKTISAFYECNAIADN
ncbi:LysR substrate-binding domain-containing protein [Sneathiella glossodoripedis]|uniref:LysR substrate-binding domain-containing protein n=1 Tax=Sneathiella glossodoripedis TaxID=418853 RepID=UPI00047097D7|nr:LysR substrate-binding domain-containing protein [Sneathiella glossodoripedis]